MNLWRLSFAYLRTQRLSAALNVLLLALGVASITVLLLLGSQLQGNLQRDADGFDLVVGAKGSPVQLILSSVYHIDVPTGNIDLAEARRWVRHRLVSEAIPLALGDSYRGFRIVGTEMSYPASYNAKLQSGRLWQAPLEAVLGASTAQQTGLRVGGQFIGAHGLAPGGHGHDSDPYRVTGILTATDTVLDRLVLTSVQSVWQLHGGAAHEAHPDEHHDGEHEANQQHGTEPKHENGHGHADEDAHGDAGHEHDHADEVPEHEQATSDHHEHAREPGQTGRHEHSPPGNAMPSVLAADFPAEGRQITALLLKSDALTAPTTLPRLINQVSSLQAAAPVPEVTRLLRLIGFGLDTLRAFAALVILAATISVFVALYNALHARRFDLAVMRSLGATRGLLLRHILLEGQILALAGVAAGLFFGHVITEVIGLWLRDAQLLRLTGWTWLPAEAGLIALGIGVGLAAAVLPAIGAYRTDIAHTLARA